jgi:hypothetical protein
MKKKEKFIMGNEVATGISATTGSPSDPLLTFVWDAVESGSNLLVKISYGLGTAVTNAGTALVPVGSSDSVEVSQDPNAPLTISGSVSVVWSGDLQSYVVTFQGGVILSNQINVTSSNINGNLNDNYPMIVYAYMNQ